jgi:hypothetical protein
MHRMREDDKDTDKARQLALDHAPGIATSMCEHARSGTKAIRATAIAAHGFQAAQGRSPGRHRSKAMESMPQCTRPSKPTTAELHTRLFCQHELLTKHSAI